jgi:hypothetical protein
MRSNLALGAFLLLLGCASSNPSHWETERVPQGFVEKEHILLEGGGYLNRDQVLSPNSVPPYTLELYKGLLSVGVGDTDIVDASVISGYSFCYGHNSGVGCVHEGFYSVYIPPNLLGKVNLGMDRNGVNRPNGDLIEVELRKTPTNHMIGILVSVYRKYDDWRDCHREHLHLEGLGKEMMSISPYGPPVAQWIECDRIEQDGWTRRLVPGAPPNGVADKPVSEWIKMRG